MKTTIPLHIDSADLARLKDHMPDLPEFEVPKLEHVGRTADETIDRLLGRSRPSIWPWVAASLGIVALVGLIAAAFAWMRRWSPEPEPVPELEHEAPEAVETPAVMTSDPYSELDVPAVAEAV